ncbi:hypothetical protein [Litorimonas sp. WD9-15]|uniref:hypothetical protein n=1 Tax=Litorimonas sp. WD9-15 TaxID=3418716 RepID=UPI003D08434E
MFRKFGISVVFILAAATFASSAFAGMMTDQEIVCPVGGETFVITGTASCSTMGRRLSLKPVTSCDFVTRLPVCPSNGLPVYRDFEEGDIKALERFMETEAYSSLQSEQPYLRAYYIAKAVETADSQEPFFLLQNGVWYGEKDAKLDELYQAELDLINESLPEEDRPFWLAAGAHHAWASGKSERAAQLFVTAKSLDSGENDYLSGYLDRLDACFRGSLEADECSSDTHIPKN